MGDATAARRPNRELHVYDFDGTLFRSPGPSLNAIESPIGGALTQPTFVPGGLGWFQSKKTLLPPYVPMKPAANDEWYVTSIVEQSRQSFADGHIVAILTGRDFYFYDRIASLLENAEIDAHHFFVKPKPKMGTVAAKVEQITWMIEKYNPSRVLLVDDREEQCNRIRTGVLRLFPQLTVDMQLVLGGTSTLSPSAEAELIETLQRDSRRYGAGRNEGRRPRN